MLFRSREPRDRLRHLLELELGARPADVQNVPGELADAMFEISSLNASNGQPAVDHIRAALELGAHAISANNVLPASVSAIRMDESPQAEVQVACGATRLVARITRASATRLSLQPGVPVFAIIKSVIVDSSN